VFNNFIGCFVKKTFKNFKKIYRNLRKNVKKSAVFEKICIFQVLTLFENSKKCQKNTKKISKILKKFSEQYI
jgi:DNA-binding ferritin-like protein (Dps family)